MNTARGNLIQFDALPSTNAYALERIGELRHGDVVVARVQTAGRGRLRRHWVSHVPGNISLSFVLKPPQASAAILAAATHYLAVVVCRVLEYEGVSAAIKWPNDVQVHGRKIAGILSESIVTGETFAGLVLGLGLNLNLSEETANSIDQPATAVNLLLGRQVNREAFLLRLVEVFFAGWDAFVAAGFESLRDEYERRALFLGRLIAVCQTRGNISGLAAGLDAAGALLVELPDGSRCKVHAGDMTVVVPRLLSGH